MGSATAEKEVTKAPVKSGTSYIVLSSVAGETPSTWNVLGSAVALTDTQAISNVIAEHNLEEGTFVAIPARSFRPRMVKVNVRRSLSIA